MRPQRSGFHAALALGKEQNLSLSKTQSGILDWFTRLYRAAKAGTVYSFSPPAGRIDLGMLNTFVRRHGFMVLPNGPQLRIANGPITFVNNTNGPSRTNRVTSRRCG